MRAPLPCTALAQSIGELFARSESKPAPSLPPPGAIGKYGERVAAAFLRRHGYRILYRNFLTPVGEIDLVCRCGEVLAFVEVKVNVALVDALSDAGADVIDVSGATVSTVQSKAAGEASTLPFTWVARTSK